MRRTITLAPVVWQIDGNEITLPDKSVVILPSLAFADRVWREMQQAWQDEMTYGLRRATAFSEALEPRSLLRTALLRVSRQLLIPEAFFDPSELHVTGKIPDAFKEG